MLSAEDLSALWLTLQVASLATSILLVIGTPLAWWATSLSRDRINCSQ